jgi:SAM-dependent methyltransferase
MTRGIGPVKGRTQVKVDSYYNDYWSDDGYQPRGTPSPYLRELIDAYVSPGTKVLDVGCGDGGTIGTTLLERGCEYIGVDVSEVAISHAVDQGFDARLIDDAASLPFEEGSFDAVFAVEVLAVLR